MTLFAIRKNMGVTQHGFVPVFRKPITTKLDLTTLADLVSGLTFYTCPRNGKFKLGVIQPIRGS